MKVYVKLRYNRVKGRKRQCGYYCGREGRRRQVFGEFPSIDEAGKTAKKKNAADELLLRAGSASWARGNGGLKHQT